jgi:hypothetical protein
MPKRSNKDSATIFSGNLSSLSYLDNADVLHSPRQRDFCESLNFVLNDLIKLPKVVVSSMLLIFTGVPPSSDLVTL